MYINKHLLSAMLATSFLSTPFRVASLILICSAIEASSGQSQSATNSESEDYDPEIPTAGTIPPTKQKKATPTISRSSSDLSGTTSEKPVPWFSLIDVMQSAKSRIGSAIGFPSETATSEQNNEEEEIQSIIKAENDNLFQKIEAIRKRFSKKVQGKIGLNNIELLAKLKESLRPSGSSDKLIVNISNTLFMYLLIIKPENIIIKPENNLDNIINLDGKIIDIKTIDIIIKNIKNLIIQIKANKKIDQYNNDTFDDEIYKKVKGLINIITESIKNMTTTYSNWKSFELNKLDLQEKNPSKVEIMNEIIDMIGLLKTKGIDCNLENLRNLTSKITEVITDKNSIINGSSIISKKQTIKDIRLTVILIKRIINLIKEAKIENKDDTYIDTQIEIIKKILKLLTINKNQNNDDDLILIDKTIQTILDLNQNNGIIKNAINLLDLLKEKNMSNQNINSIINFIFYITKIITEDDPYYNLSWKTIISIVSMIKSLVKKSYF